MKTQPNGRATPPRPVDKAKVESIRRRIAGGSYAVDPERIADRLVASGELSDAER